MFRSIFGTSEDHFFSWGFLQTQFFCIIRCFPSGHCSDNSHSKALTNVIFVSAGCAAGSISVVQESGKVKSFLLFF